jgi:hypothetical protein
MDEDRRNWIIVIVLVIPLILIFFIFGPSYYETLTINGKRVFMLVFQIIFLYTISGLVLRWFEGRHKVKDDMNEKEEREMLRILFRYASKLTLGGKRLLIKLSRWTCVYIREFE